MLRSKFHPARDAALAWAAALLFAWLAWLASRASVPPFDTAVRDAVHAFAQPWLTLVMKAASQAGGGWVLWPAGVLIVGLLARAARGREAVLFGVAVAGAELVSETMKLFFHRPRPEPWFEYPLPPTYSFPSGHAIVSFCFFLCLAEVLIRGQWPLARKAAMWCAALACTLTIGLSRVYLGVHYPTDVLGGYAAGIVWTTLIRVMHHAWQEEAGRSGGG
ncbi:MAG: phosphatase PAP2 family protein [Candidatus Solibacter sp.]